MKIYELWEGDGLNNRIREYKLIKLNDGRQVKLNTFLSISDYLSLKETTKTTHSKEALEELLSVIFILPDDQNKIGKPLSHEILSHIAYELYVNEFIDKKSLGLDEMSHLLKENQLFKKSIEKFKLMNSPPSVQAPTIKINMKKIQSISSSMQKAVASVNAFTKSFNGVVEKLGEQLRSLAKDVSQYVEDIEADEDDNNIIKFYLYDEAFKDVNILVDDSFFAYIRDNYESIFDFIESIPSERDEKKLYLERVFLEYWINCIEENPEAMTIIPEDSHNTTTLAFLRELKITMGNANYIAATMLLHIYLEKLIQNQLDKFQYKDFKEVMNVDLTDKLDNASETTKFRYILKHGVHAPLTNILEKSLKAFDKYAPLYFFTRALYLYDRSEVFQRRNNIIHFNDKAKYEAIDLMQMMKLFQLLKIVLENKEVPGLLDEWTKTTNQKIHPLEVT